MTATLLAEDKQALLQLTGIHNAGLRLIHLPVERTNMRTVFRTLSHGLEGVSFPDIAWIARGNLNVVIYAASYDLGWRVYSYLLKRG